MKLRGWGREPLLLFLPLGVLLFFNSFIGFFTVSIVFINGENLLSFVSLGNPSIVLIVFIDGENLFFCIVRKSVYRFYCFFVFYLSFLSFGKPFIVFIVRESFYRFHRFYHWGNLLSFLSF